jgi:predicted CoA-binding protein
MRPRIKKESLTPSSVRVFSTFATPEEQKRMYEMRKTLKEHDALIGTLKPKHYYVKIFGKEMELSLQEIQMCNFKYYTR